MFKIAVSLALPDTEACLMMLSQLVPAIGMAEICLDLMKSFDLSRLITQAPCPLIITYRPQREGGCFNGSETERLDILKEAVYLKCAYVDIEWDSIAEFANQRGGLTKLIVSRHWMNDMPSQSLLWATYEELKKYADVVKLVGMAHCIADMLPIFHFLRRATSPVIGIAMGRLGQLTRLFAPCFTHCLLTYAASTPSAITAPGQLSVSEMRDLYNLQFASTQPAFFLHLCVNTSSIHTITKKNSIFTSGKFLYAPLVVSIREAIEIVPELKLCLPHLTLTADASLVEALHDKNISLSS